ncbi:MAG TPA: septal ring lytic transglycosylase RlpA family protein [Burkholderiales bacterium]|nr:septal ring lytic transglycosylase RlpA family protein [Burkholderiales bacterium]
MTADRGSRIAGRAAALFTVAMIAACGSAPKPPPAEPKPAERPAADATGQKPLSCVVPEVKQKRGGAYYLDDGPHESAPPNLDLVPDAVPRAEPVRAANMKPYEALGKTYVPMTRLEPYRERGVASWYGRRYHGQKTASGEVYDMYGMTAAHPTLPIPSYVRVTNVRNGRSVVLRVNDRGPFKADRVIDLSFTAACKLDILGGGSQLVEVETIIPGAEPPTQVAAPPPPPAPQAAKELQPPAPAADTAGSRTAAPATVASAAERPDVTAALSPVPEPAGVYLQLGAFGARDNADNFLGHLKAQLAWLSDRMSVRQKDGLYRVHAGPYPSQSDARKAADRIAQTLGFKPLLTSW